MTDLEISEALALAIGWEEDRIDTSWSGVVFIDISDEIHLQRKIFDYRDWNVIGPIAAKYDTFPNQYRHLNNQWVSRAVVDDEYGEAIADTPQKAIALAVIQGAKT